MLMIYYYTYTGIADNLKNALEQYQKQKNINLKAHFMTNSYVTSIYDVKILLQMLTLDGFTYKFVSKELNNNAIHFSISKEEVEKHLRKAQELNIWVNRDEESYSKRVLLLNNLQK